MPVVFELDSSDQLEEGIKAVSLTFVKVAYALSHVLPPVVVGRRHLSMVLLAPSQDCEVDARIAFENLPIRTL